MNTEQTSKNIFMYIFQLFKGFLVKGFQLLQTEKH